MSYTIKKLDKNYNHQLLELAATRTTGSSMFNVDRKPDFFALADEFGKTEYFGIFKDEQLIGSQAVAKQRRMINGAPETVLYLFDLKVHPAWAGKTAYFRLAQHVTNYYKEIEKVNWMFTTILDTNENTRSMTKGLSAVPGAALIGKNYHVGFPLFMPGKRSCDAVKNIHPEVAWQFYLTTSTCRNFSPCDEELFLKDNGAHFGCFENGKLVAVSKLVDQSHARRIYLTGKQPVSYRILNLLCIYYKCPLLPREQQVFKHGYLSYYLSANGKDYRKSFIDHIKQNYSDRFSYIFCGMNADEARNYSGKFLINFTSSTYGYGSLPENLKLDSVELTLI
jgi:hypothetical protein